ncbi:MAG: uracil-DNA glycosylase [Pseudomonadota bacterium]
MDCARCARLVAYRAENRRAQPAWVNAPVPSCGDPKARLLIVGLAPGRGGANRTGIPFFGDASGHMLHSTLAAFGWTQGPFYPDAIAPPQLVGAMITNAVRCAPPGNRPTASEIAACAPFLSATLAQLDTLSVVLALGRVAHEACLRALKTRPSTRPFAHGAVHHLGALVLVDSYHCSRLNTNTGRLTEDMFDAVFATIAGILAQPLD